MPDFIPPKKNSTTSSHRKDFSDFLEEKVSEGRHDNFGKEESIDSLNKQEFIHNKSSPSLLADLLIPTSALLRGLKSAWRCAFFNQNKVGSSRRSLILFSILGLVVFATVFILTGKKSFDHKNNKTNGGGPSSRSAQEEYIDKAKRGITDPFKQDSDSTKAGYKAESHSNSTRLPRSSTDLPRSLPPDSNVNLKQGATTEALELIDNYISIGATEKGVDEAEKYLAFPIDYYDEGLISREKWRTIHSAYLRDTFNRNFIRLGNAKVETISDNTLIGSAAFFKVFTVIAADVSSVSTRKRSQLIIAKEYTVRSIRNLSTIVADKQNHRQVLNDSNLNFLNCFSEGAVFAHDNTGYMNLRTGPSVDSPIIKKLHNGTRIKYIPNTNSNWWFALTENLDIGIIYSTGIE